MSEITELNDPDICSPALESALGICLSSGFPIAVYWGQNFTFFYNEEFTPILGDKHPKALGEDAKDVFAEIWDNLMQQLTTVFTQGTTIKMPDAPFLLNRHGYVEECYFDYTLSPIYNSQGKIEGIFNVVMETTNKVIGQRRDRLLNNLMQIESTVQPVEKCISNCKIILNENQQEIPFYLIYLKAKDNVYNLVASGGIAQIVDHQKWPIEDLIRSGHPVHLNSISDYLSEPIATFYPEPCCQAVIIPLKNTNAPISGYMVTGLSPRKKNDSEYLKFIKNIGSLIGSCLSSAFSFDEFLALEREKENLLGIVSHELKTPITSIKAYAQLVMRDLKKKGDVNNSQLMVKMAEQINKLNLVITDMLDGTNFNDGRIKFYNSEFSFDDLVLELLNEIPSPNNNNTIQIKLGGAGYYSGDRIRVSQVISNLLSNALKYSPDGGEILIETSKNNGNITFSITDQGIGINKDEQQKIFQRFYRSVNLKQYTYGGIGLGLFISGEIIKLMGGKLWCESEEGKGSIFHFTLPLR